ncbi:MAG: T9SS type A sorting domain-containing protein, partial [Bacteroidota bacterium]
VAIRLCSYLGTEVLSLPQTTKNTGHHALKLETASLSPGIYILKFDVGKSFISKKIVVVK